MSDVYDTPPPTPRRPDVPPPPKKAVEEEITTPGTEKKLKKEEASSSFSLRGSSPKAKAEPSPQIETRTIVDREIKISVNVLPTQFHMYPTWRFQLKVAITTTSNIDPDETEAFVSAMNTWLIAICHFEISVD